MTDRKKCPQCGYSNRALAKVCANCGHRFALVQDIEGLKKYCTQCGTANRIRARVCVQCGTTFRQKWCPQCGNHRRPGAKVCSNCGYRFRAPMAAPEPPVVPNTDPPLSLPPEFDLPDLPPPRDVPIMTPPAETSTPLAEPAPYISSDELNQLRGKGIYKRTMLSRKGKP